MPPSDRKKTILTIVGARPQFIKAAPVSQALVNGTGSMPGNGHQEVICHTGQHYDANMSQIFFDQLGIRPPEFNLGISALSHGAMTGKMLGGLEAILQSEKPDWVLVYGDTNSTLAGALAAAKLDLPVAHVEAGLRSFNRRMPEEINRVVTDHVATLLFCPTRTAVDNLAAEGITRGVHLVGDVMYDAFLRIQAAAREQSRILERMQLASGRYALATVHRQENTDDRDRLRSILDALGEIAAGDGPVVLPLHPRTQSMLDKWGMTPPPTEHLRVVPPVGYLDMVALETSARAILTDSGGIQKEAFFAKVPCITLRDETEWVELVDMGVNQVVGADAGAIVAAYHRALQTPYPAVENVYGDGLAAEKIVAALNSI